MSLFSKYFLFSIFLLSSTLFSQTLYDSPPHAQVLEHNLNLLSTLPFTTIQNCEQGSPQNPISCPHIMSLIHPSINNRISTQTNSTIILQWGANIPNSIQYFAPGGCSQDKYVFTKISGPRLSGVLNYTISNFSKEYQITTNSPFTTADFSQIPLALLTTQNISPFLPNITFSFNGEISADYLVTHYYYRILIIGKNSVCKQYIQSYQNTYKSPLTSKTTYLLEYGSPHFILLQPIDNEQSSYSPQLKTAILSNQDAQKIIFQINQNTTASTNLSKYKIMEDEFGFQQISKLQSNSTNSQLIFTNSTNAFLSPPQFSKTNYSYQYYSHYSGVLPLGNSNLTITLQDDFNNNFSRNLTLQTNQLSAISLNGTNFTLKNSSLLTIQNSFDQNTRKTNSLSSQFQKLENISALMGIFLLFLIGAKIFGASPRI